MSADITERGQRMVVCSANKYGSFILLGARHWDALMHKNAELVGVNWIKEMRRLAGEQQGFIDQHGEFMTREEAWTVAEAAGQIRFRCGGDGAKLFSENLY